jgi:hypothetical protein
MSIDTIFHYLKDLLKLKHTRKKDARLKNPIIIYTFIIRGSRKWLKNIFQKPSRVS